VNSYKASPVAAPGPRILLGTDERALAFVFSLSDAEPPPPRHPVSMPMWLRVFRGRVTRSQASCCTELIAVAVRSSSAKQGRGNITGDPRRYRLHADECIRAAESAASLEAREEFIALAHVSLRLAAQFENGERLMPARKNSDARGLGNERLTPGRPQRLRPAFRP
jgi:hypothetical protein